MTSIVGIYCSDGIVIGTDSSATFSQGNMRTIEQPLEKIEIIGENVIVAGTGAVGLGQRFNNIVRVAHSENEFKDPFTITKKLSRTFLEDANSTHVDLSKLNFGALVAFPSEKGIQLCEFDPIAFQPELKTQMITDPFLGFIRDTYWDEGIPTVNEAIFATAWTLDHAIKVNPGGVNGPVRIATLQRNKYKVEAHLLDDNELQEHRQFIQESKDKLKEMRTLNPHVPDIPKKK